MKESQIFVQPFVSVQDVQGVRGCGLRRKPLPSDATEAFAVCAIRFAQWGTTLAFVPQARQVDGTAKKIVECIQLLRSLAKNVGESWSFPTPDSQSPQLLRAIEVVRDDLGDGSIIEQLLRAGVAVHRGGLPSRVRVAIERLIRSGEIRLVVATTTLAQGVNFPIRTVLVRGLQQGKTRTVDATTFWNIAGRAGRAMHENEGQVLFFNDTGRKPGVVRRQRRIMSAIVDRSGIHDVIGLLHRFLSFVAEGWRRESPGLPLEDLCRRIAEDDFDWAPEENRKSIEQIFQLVDQHLLAFVVEGEFEHEQADALEDILRESLLFAQIEARPIDSIDSSAAQAIIGARVRRIFARVPSVSRRSRFYKMGFVLRDCEAIHDAREELFKLIRSVGDWSDLELDDHVRILMSLVQLASGLEATTHAVQDVPESSSDIVESWVRGGRCVDMVREGLGAEFDGDPARLGRFVEEYCVYGLAWSVSGFVAYAREAFAEADEAFPEVASHLPSMFKEGVPDPLAAVFVSYLQGDRGAAIGVARVSPYGIERVAQGVAWLHDVTAERLIELGLDQETARRACARRRESPNLRLFEFEDSSITWDLRIDGPAGFDLTEGDPVIIRPDDDLVSGRFALFDLEGNRLGEYRLRGRELPEWFEDALRLEARVRSVAEIGDGQHQVSVHVRNLGA